MALINGPQPYDDRRIYLHVELDGNGCPRIVDQLGRELSGVRSKSINTVMREVVTATIDVIMHHKDVNLKTIHQKDWLPDLPA
jgi:hypothetical protein